MGSKNLSYSSAYGVAFAQTKERALHEYRDQERQARRDIADLRDSEGALHRFWRRQWRQDIPPLTVREEVASYLNLWRAPVSRHNSGSGPRIEVRDPTTEDF